MAGLQDMFGGGVSDRLLGLPERLGDEDVAHLAVLGADCATPYPSIMPAVIAPTGGGLTHAQALAVLKGAAARAPIAAFALVEFMPGADRDGLGARTAGQILTSVLGIIAAQRVTGSG